MASCYSAPSTTSFRSWQKTFPSGFQHTPSRGRAPSLAVSHAWPPLLTQVMKTSKGPLAEVRDNSTNCITGEEFGHEMSVARRCGSGRVNPV